MTAEHPEIDIIRCSDREYWEITGLCGGCISEECHPGIPCRVGPDGCRYCETRYGAEAIQPPKPKPAPDPNQGTLL